MFIKVTDAAETWTIVKTPRTKLISGLILLGWSYHFPSTFSFHCFLDITKYAFYRHLALSSTSLVSKEFSSWPQSTESPWLIQWKDTLQRSGQFPKGCLHSSLSPLGHSHHSQGKGKQLTPTPSPALSCCYTQSLLHLLPWLTLALSSSPASETEDPGTHFWIFSISFLTVFGGTWTTWRHGPSQVHPCLEYFEWTWVWEGRSFWDLQRDKSGVLSWSQLQCHKKLSAILHTRGRLFLRLSSTFSLPFESLAPTICPTRQQKGDCTSTEF